jgi:hypothetical protein
MIAVSTEIPIGTTPKPGPVLTAAISRPLPGRFADAIALGARVGQALRKVGAEARLVQTGIAGTQSGSMVLSTEYPSMAAFGEIGDKFLDSPEGQAIMTEVGSASSPVTMLSQDIFTEITL